MNKQTHLKKLILYSLIKKQIKLLKKKIFDSLETCQFY
jgi:hypothetical protein